MTMTSQHNTEPMMAQQRVLEEMFLPPSSSTLLQNNNNNNNNNNSNNMESHSDTEVELGEHNDNNDNGHANHRSSSRSLSCEEIVVDRGGEGWKPIEDPHRAVHRIRLSALEHNYHQVEAAASRQKCSVITVVKADGYGHGAIATALHLADHCGADAFAVATLEEGIALRKAFAANPAGQWSKQLASYFHTTHVEHHASSEMTSAVVHPLPSHSAATSLTCLTAAATTLRRPARIRILVLGPPVGFPRCFDDYFHHNIEVMVSGPEVAASLIHWVADEAQRKRTAVERAANEAKYAALYSSYHQPQPQQQQQQQQQRSDKVAGANSAPASVVANTTGKKETGELCYSTASSTTCSVTTNGSGGKAVEAAATTSTVPAKKALPHPSSTLGNVQGVEMAREVRSLMLKQHEAKFRHQRSFNTTSAANSVDDDGGGGGGASDHSSSGAPAPRPPVHETSATTLTNATTASTITTNADGQTTLFGGIEAAARSSRMSQAAVAKAAAILQEENDDDSTNNDEADSSGPSPLMAIAVPTPPPSGGLPTIRKRLRWHALVDSGMGRLGFKTDIVSAHDKTGRRDTVAVLQEMIDLELDGNAPLEFYGMCTHMADARDLSEYTNSQMNKFKALLKRVRAAGISVPTISTDNSAALLTTSLKHFDPVEMLSQADADTRGFVRTGGAIYGQRPSFPQLKAVSTLLASVRHVAILKKGDTVGYDRAYTAPHDVRIATLTIGFADGYPRELGNGVGKVQIRGAAFPVAGNVCMDMMMVELGEANDKTGVGASVVVGDTAVLWGPLDEDVENGRDNQEMVRLQDIAAKLKTTQSALTCGLDKMRVRRQFV